MSLRSDLDVWLAQEPERAPHEALDALERARTRLPLDHAAILDLLQAGHSAAEIARRMGWSYGRARRRIAEAVQRVRIELAKLGIDGGDVR